MQVPEGNVHAQVHNGWVTLDGEVEYGYQRHEVERMVRQVRGVIGVTNTITVKPSASPQNVQAVIEETFKREAEINARHISVEVSDHTAKLYGHVHSIHEANAAAAAAAAASRNLRRGEPSRGHSPTRPVPPPPPPPPPGGAGCAPVCPPQLVPEPVRLADQLAAQRPGGLAGGGIGPHQLAQPVLLVTGRGQVGEDGGHGQPGDRLRGRLSWVPDQGQRLGCALRDTRAVAPIGMTLRWVNLGISNAPACRTPARPTSPVRLARCHVPAVN